MSGRATAVALSLIVGGFWALAWVVVWGATR